MEQAALSPLGPLLQFETRLLWPFFLTAGTAEKASATLAERREERWPKIWQPAEASTAYQDELLDQVSHFFFSNTDGGRYLRVPADTADAWFKRTTIDLDDAPRSRIEICPTPGLELFLTNWGVGVLSITLTSPHVADPLIHADFDYRLSRLHGGGSPLVRTADVWPEFLERQLKESSRQSKRYRENLEAQLRTAQERWQAMPEAQRAPIEQARREWQTQHGMPDDPATPIAQRLGAAGGAFTLPEFRDFLLAPLAPLGLEAAQENFCVYTVARFGPQVDFNDPAAKRAGALLISRLVQVEERHHAGTLNDEVCVPSAILNPRHFAAVGLLGGAHLVADQPPEGDGGAPIAFNEQRLPRVRDKYFVPYLLALVQTFVLQRSSQDAANLVRQPGKLRDASFDNLVQQFREFSVAGNFSRASSRAALHRYYQVARQGLDVPANWNDARQTLGDLDAKIEAWNEQDQLAALELTSRQQAQLSSKMDKSLSEMVRLQRMAEIIEIFIIGVYAAHLAHMMFPGLFAFVAPYFGSDVHAIAHRLEAEAHAAHEEGDEHASAKREIGPATASQLESKYFTEAQHIYQEREHMITSGVLLVIAAITIWFFVRHTRHRPANVHAHAKAPH